jgi:hypothetical protein
MASGAVHLMREGVQGAVILSPTSVSLKSDIFTTISALTKQFLAATSLKLSLLQMFKLY